MGWSRKLNIIALLLLCCSVVMPVAAQDDAEQPAYSEDDGYYWDDEPQTEPERQETPAIDPDRATNPPTINKQEFDKNRWKEVTEGMDYQPKQVKKQKPAEEEPDANSSNTTQNDYDDSPRINWTGLFSLGPLAKVIVIVAMVILLAVIIYFLVTGTTFSNKNLKGKGEVKTLEELEENLHESDLERALRLALEKGDYRLAIRIYYLIIIKELSLRNWIIWKKDKTNGEYVREMAARSEYDQFRNITIDFDRVWYGDVTVGEREYQLLHPRFRVFLENLKTPGKA